MEKIIQDEGMLPKARGSNIVVQEIGKEILMYDLNVHKAYSLNETTAVVYKACDGNTRFDNLKERSKLSDDIIYLALDELFRENLLEDSGTYRSPFTGMNRRDVIKRVGFASMIALPIISSLVAPNPAMAQSACQDNNTTCASGAQCCSGNCFNTNIGGKICCAPGVVNGFAPNDSTGCSSNGCVSFGDLCCSGSARSVADQFCSVNFNGADACICN